LSDSDRSHPMKSNSACESSGGRMKSLTAALPAESKATARIVKPRSR
jgi:hypothetical protein